MPTTYTKNSCIVEFFFICSCPIVDDGYNINNLTDMATKKAAAAESKKQKTTAIKSGGAKPAAVKKGAMKRDLEVNASGTKTKSTMHPNYREISVEMTDGTTFKTWSTYHNNVLKLDVDVKTHPAWTKDVSYINTKASAVAKFNNRFNGMSFLDKK